MLEKILNIISAVLLVPLEELSTNTSAENLQQWDSMGHLNLILSVEQEFNVQFDTDEVVKMTSVAHIIEALKAKGVEA